MTETELASLEALAKAKAVAWTNQFALDVTSLRGADVPYEQPMWSEPSPDHSIPLFSSAAILSLIEEYKRMREALEYVSQALLSIRENGVFQYLPEDDGIATGAIETARAALGGRDE